MLKLVGLIFVIFISVFVARIPILTWAIQTYAKKYDQNLQFEITRLNFNELSLKNINLNKKNRIPLLEINFDIWASDVIKKMQVTVETLDVESLQASFAKMSSDTAQDSSPMPFSEAQELCSMVQKIDLQIQWRELVFGSKHIPITLQAANKIGVTQIEWDDQKNSKGLLQLKCTPEAISVDAERFALEVRDSIFKDYNIKNFSLKLHQTKASWTAKSPLEWSTPGSASLSYTKDKQHHIWDLPSFEVHGQKSETDIFSGTFKISKLSWGSKQSGDQLKSLTLSGEFFKSVSETKLNLDVRDHTREIFVDDLEVVQNEEFVRIKINAKKTKMEFNNRHAELLPATKQLVKSLSGTFRLGGDILYENERWKGSVHLIGEDISSSSEYGDYEGVSFSHWITSLDHLSTPNNQTLTIKKISMGPGVDNLKVVYQMPDVNTILVRKFNAQAGKGELYAENFTIYPQKKRIENFLAQIVNVDLETLLAIGLQDTVKAKGRLHGHLGISYHGKHPVFKGLLTDPQNGWIQYRTGNEQAAGLKFSDGPMDILNNYLYDFQYQNLSLSFTSDTNYDMHVTLAALGYNPHYLNGKPLKLNVNLQQNLLAALQSVMLTYDLPSRIKEKFEKVTE